MRPLLLCLSILMLIITACQSTPSAPTAVPVERVTETPTLLAATASPSETPSPVETDTPTTPPAGLIRVDTTVRPEYCDLDLSEQR
jgi:hypothetical protein